MSSNSKNLNQQDELRRKVKKRLSMWDSFFSQVEEKFGNSSSNDKTCLGDEEISVNDLKYVTVQEEHSKLRTALRLEHGINTDSEISESETERQEDVCETDVEPQEELCETYVKTPDGLKNLNVNDNFTSENLSSVQENFSRKSEVLNDKSSKKRMEKCINLDVDIKSKHQENYTKAEKSPSKYLGQEQKSYIINAKTQNLHENTKNVRSKSLNALKIRQGKVIEESKSLHDPETHLNPNSKPKQLKSPVKKTSLYNVHQGLSSSTCYEMRSELGNTMRPSCAINLMPDNTEHLHQLCLNTGLFSKGMKNFISMFEICVPDTHTGQPLSKESIVEMCKQYDLWKLHKRRKSGHLGSVYIVSSLDEEPCDANRYVPELPPVVKKPFTFKRRFSLKKL